jgi:uncharacterized membrane protein
MDSHNPQTSEIAPGAPDLTKEKNITMAVYALQAAAFISGITVIAAVIINYIKKEDVQGTWLASHFPGR